MGGFPFGFHLNKPKSDPRKVTLPSAFLSSPCRHLPTGWLVPPCPLGRQSGQSGALPKSTAQIGEPQERAKAQKTSTGTADFFFTDGRFATWFESPLSFASGSMPFEGSRVFESHVDGASLGDPTEAWPFPMSVQQREGPISDGYK